MIMSLSVKNQRIETSDITKDRESSRLLNLTQMPRLNEGWTFFV